jgi:SAM-dependent methyltransferase
MHASSYQLMAKLRACIAPGSKVLDVGGADVNGSYRPLFGDCTYTSLDFENADIIVTGYEWPIDDGAFDAVISGQALEHDGMFWVTTRNIARVLRPGGRAILIVPSTGPVHRHPVDCYRFLPDSMKALATWARLKLVSVERLDNSQWRDLGAVFAKPSKRTSKSR